MSFNFDVFGNVEKALESAPKGGMLQPGSYFNGVVESATWRESMHGDQQLQVVFDSGDDSIPGRITKFYSLNSDNERVVEVARNELSLLAHYAGLKKCSDPDDLVGARVFFDVWERARKDDPSKMDIRVSVRGPAVKKPAVLRQSKPVAPKRSNIDDVIEEIDIKLNKAREARKVEIDDADIPF